MALALIGGLALLGVLGGIIRFAMNPIGATVGLVRTGAFLFGAAMWFAYASIGVEEVFPVALGATVVWVIALIIPAN